MTGTARGKKKTSQQKLIDNAERFAAGCTRDRLELRLVDEVKRLQKRIDRALAYIESADDFGDELDADDMKVFLTTDYKFLTDSAE